MSTRTTAYIVRRACLPPRLDGSWTGPDWRKAETARIASFHPASPSRHPRTKVKVLYDSAGLYVSFLVQDRYVRAISRKYLDMVCRDSCAEFFIRPKPGKGYFNFEVNCGGTALIYYIEDPARIPGGFRKFRPVEPGLFRKMRIYHSMPRRTPEETKKMTTWRISYFIPFSLMEAYIGKIGRVPGSKWRGNFYKCADETSHPHWASWASIGRKLNFHQPSKFATIRFA